MRWDCLPAPPAKIALAQALVDLTSRMLWGRRALRLASRAVARDPHHWRDVFPGGAREAIWFISDVSDASMRAAFMDTRAVGMSDVIAERLAQNADLKPFVRRVMLFDGLHPVQGVRRMQRTARVMLSCLPEPRASAFTVSALNLFYTGIVFVWLMDPHGRPTHAATRGLMRILRL